ncbi:hypothetical protein FZEAL_10273 [Fusarium zealandicum]|uniref:Uncharacterized protein n=1 Tax=Fusarium zealandicum TaxID=1053134 RepID=A0A8H4U3H2_9HYPO|nr:hypothetical protein FZEAL_10273 [Fusarium zealandicum]
MISSSEITTVPNFELSQETWKSQHFAKRPTASKPILRTIPSHHTRMVKDPSKGSLRVPSPGDSHLQTRQRHQIAKNAEPSRKQLVGSGSEVRLLKNSLQRCDKVMSEAQFESYLEVKKDSDRNEAGQQTKLNDEDQDTTDYKSDDEDKGTRREIKQRRQQEVHLINYRQHMMKTTGDAAVLPLSSKTSTTIWSSSADTFDEGKHDHVPLSLHRAQRLPGSPRTRLAGVRSDSNLRMASMDSAKRPGSAQSTARGHNSHSRLPAFARNLPRDPFARTGGEMPNSAIWPSHGQQPIYPGGLVGFIASEERSRAMRRGSPKLDSRSPAPDTRGQPKILQWTAGIPHMQSGEVSPVYGASGAQQPVFQIPQQTPNLGPKMQPQMVQQTPQHSKMEMKSIQIIPAVHREGLTPVLPLNNLAVSSSSDLPHHLSPRMCTSGLNYASLAPHGPQSGPMLSNHRPGKTYTSSTAPSERNNVGLPGRYRTISRATTHGTPGTDIQTNDGDGIDECRGAREAESPVQDVDRGILDDQEASRVKKEKKDRRKAVCLGNEDFGIGMRGMA